MKSPRDDTEHRRPVWEALSDLYLDTDTALSRSWRVGVLASSPYSIEDLECILSDEIHPVCRGNLWSIAGEWDGFDMSVIEERILRKKYFLFRWLGWYRRLVVQSVNEWRMTKSEVERMRMPPAKAD